MTTAYICDFQLTPIGRYRGALLAVRPDDMAAHVIRALIARNPNLDPDRIHEVYLGCANQAGEDNRNVARMATLLAGPYRRRCPRPDAEPPVRTLLSPAHVSSNAVRLVLFLLVASKACRAHRL